MCRRIVVCQSLTTPATRDLTVAGSQRTAADRSPSAASSRTRAALRASRSPIAWMIEARLPPPPAAMADVRCSSSRSVSAIAATRDY